MPVAQLSWTLIAILLPIKDENKRNYYINLCIKNNLSKRELIREIKSNSYERLIDKPEKIDIITPTKYSITTKLLSFRVKKNNMKKMLRLFFSILFL